MASALYRGVVSTVDRFVPSKLRGIWEHPAGPKTVFFWAPTMKWCLVGAGIADIARPADKLSLTQSGALAATGMIWARYSMVIIPKNYNLFCVNIFVGATGLYQLARIFNHRRSLEVVSESQWHRSLVDRFRVSAAMWLVNSDRCATPLTFFKAFSNLKMLL